MKYKKIIFKSFWIFSMLFVIGFMGVLVYVSFMPDFSIKNSNQFYLYDSSDNIVYQGSKTNEWVELKNISQYLIDAVIATEDRNFYDHNGFDYIRIASAMMKNIKKDAIVGGASTISQQLVKNMFLEFDQVWSRKAKEALLTIKVESIYNKDEILEGYLNTINYGQGNYGIKSASAYYFNKLPSELSLEEAAILAGIPKSPNNYNPISNYDKSIERAKSIIKHMIDNGYLDKVYRNQLFNEKIEIYGVKESNNLKTLMYYQDAVLKEMQDLGYITEDIVNRGIKIYTNLDMNAQKSLEDAITNNMKEDNTQVASIVINPKTGAITALAGGKDYSKSQFNRVIESKRQVGSTIKPLLYYAALENGMTSSSTFLSKPTTFVFSNNKEYSPINYNNNYGYQNITMTAALAYSDNIFAVKTHLFLGTDTLVDTVKKMGMKNEINNNPAMALGSGEINMVDFATAYATIANEGKSNDLTTIRRIEDMNGNILYKADEKQEEILDKRLTYILSEMLTSTYNSAFINYNIPTLLSYATKMTHKYAVKTGSTGTDYWVVGYNPDVLTLVWNGNDENTEELSTAYSKISKNIWLETMEGILKDKENNWYDLPETVVAVPKDAVTGKEPVNSENAFLYYYIKGTEEY